MTPPRPPSADRLQRWLTEQRWYARGDQPASVTGVERVALGTKPAVDVVLVATADGGRYQLLQRDGTPDRATQPEVAAALATFIATEGEATAPGVGTVRARSVGRSPLGTADARPLGAEQSNTSVMVGGTHVLKVLRRLQPGPHPEVEVGMHLALADDVPVPRLAGWSELIPDDGGEPTVLVVVHDLVPGALDGWSLVLSALAADPNAVLARLHDLGGAVARLHGALARPGEPDADGRPTFGAQPLDPREVWALGDRVLADPEVPDDARPVVAHAVATVGTDAGAAIRLHGDLHLGQTVVGPDGWVILDFEGEPSRPLAERREVGSPLRDVAGMLRSLDYAAATHARAGNDPLPLGWEAAARAALLDGYLAAADPALLPTSAASVHHLLALHELEKAAYEVGYEKAHRPDWIDIPRQGLARRIERAPR